MDTQDAGGGAAGGGSRYLFTFLGEDDARYTRRLYWQSLHVVAHRGRNTLVAARVVPRTGELFALYLAFKRQRRAVHRELLPELCANTPPDSAEQLSVCRSIVDLLPAEPSDIPAPVLEQSQALLEAAVGDAMARGLPIMDLTRPSTASTGMPWLLAPRMVGSGRLDVLAGLNAEDVSRVRIGFEVHSALEERIAQIAQAAAAQAGAGSVVTLQRKVESELMAALHRDRRYLDFVQWVMDAPGGFVAPVVKDFLVFYWRGIRQTVEERSEKGQFDAGFWRERFQALLGEMEAESLHTHPYHGITVLGDVLRGELVLGEGRGEALATVHDVRPATDLKSILLKPVRGRVRRGMVELALLTLLRRKIDTIEFVG